MQGLFVGQKKYALETRETASTRRLVALAIVKRLQLRLSVSQISIPVRRVVQIPKSQLDSPVIRERFAVEVKHLLHQVQACGGFGF